MSFSSDKHIKLSQACRDETTKSLLENLFSVQFPFFNLVTNLCIIESNQTKHVLRYEHRV